MRGLAERSRHGALAMRSLRQMMREKLSIHCSYCKRYFGIDGSSPWLQYAQAHGINGCGCSGCETRRRRCNGLITRAADNKYAILTDILGDEDHLGDMDFKVTGKRDGICGVQMDIKVDGLSMDTMREGTRASRRGRLFILMRCMHVCLPHVKK